MAKQHLEINEGELIPLQNVRRVMPVTETDLKSLKDLNDTIDLKKFNTKVDIAGQGEFFASQSMGDFKKQGIDFLQVSDRAYVPKDNFIKARDLNDKDRIDFKTSTTRNMHQVFKSRLETSAGTVLSDVSAKEVLDRMAKPLTFDKKSSNINSERTSNNRVR